MLPRRLSEPGPVLDYLRMLLAHEGTRTQAKQTIRDIKALLDLPAGRILLDLLDKSTLERSVPVLGDVRALEALNAQSFIALDLRRIASDELDALLEDASVGDAGGAGKRRKSIRHAVTRADDG